MKTFTVSFVFTILFISIFSLSGNAQCAPEISGYTNIGLYNGHNYYLSNTNARPTDAQAAAEALGGYLVAINDEDENNLLKNYIDELTYIGFNDVTTEGTLETFNGESITYNNVDPCNFCQSNDADNDYVVMEPWGDGEWSFSNFWNARKYIVEVPCGRSNNSSECSFINEVVTQGFPSSTVSGLTRMLENADDYEFRSESVTFGAGRRLVSWKFDKLGNEISITDVSFPYPSGMDFGRISTLGEYFFMHEIVGLNPQLNKYDFLGNTIFSKTYTVNTTISNINYTASRDAWEDEDGILVTGHSGDGPDGLRQPFLIKTDLDGNEQWQVLLPTENNFVSLNVQGRSNDGGYYLILSIGGNVPEKIIKTDAIGNILWTHETPLNSSIVNRDHLGESGDGSSYYYVQNDPGSSSSIGYWGFKLNASTGAVIWEKEIGEIFSVAPSLHDFGGNGAAISDDGGLFVDFSYFLGNTYVGDKYGKLDGNGNLVWGYDKPTHFRRTSIRLGTSDGGAVLFGLLGNDFSKRFVMKITSDGSYAPICEGGNNNATLTANCDFGFPSPFPDNPFVYIDPANNPNGEAIQWDAPTGMTTCPGGILTIELVNGLPSGSIFTVGNYDVLYKISDACGNEKFCSLELRVRGPAPIINCNNDITVDATNASGAVVNYDWPTVEMPAGGTCSYNDFTLYTGTNTASGSQFPIGTTEVIYRASRTGSPSLCEHLPDINFCSFNVTVLDNGTGGCPDDIPGFITLGEFGDSKYYISTVNDRPEDAQAVAESFGGYLVSINSQAENDFIQQGANGLTYIGLNDASSEGNFEWFNGDPVTYNNINPCGFCNENSAAQDYAVIQPWDGGWSFSSFNNGRKYIMEIPCGSANGLQVDCDLNIDPAQLTVVGTNDITGNIVDWTPPTATTDCTGGVIIQQIQGPQSGSFLEAWVTGDYVVQYRITDACGNEEICTTVINVEGIEGEFNCLDDIIVDATSPSGAIVFYDMPTITPSTCPPFSPQLVQGLPSGSEFPIGTTQVTITSLLGGSLAYCQNTIVCSFNVTVTDGSSGGGCPNDISGFTTLGEFGDSKYYISNDIARPVDAQAEAASHGGYLVTVNSQAENDFIQQYADGLTYIGLTDENTEGNFEWFNGESFSYNNINPCGFCNENAADQDYGVIQPWDGGWSFSNFYNSRKYIMEIPCDGGPSDLPDLTVSNITNLPNLGEPSEVIFFNFDLNNIGTTTASGSYVIEIYLSEDPIYSSDDAFAGEIPTGDTPVGTIAAVPAAITVPGLVGGDYYLIVVADVMEDIAESNENNNTLAVSFGVNTASGCPTSLSGFTALGEYNGFAYYLSDDISRPTDAQNTAASLGGHLAVINSQGENDFISNQINELVYIGINDAAIENTLAWVNSSPVGYTNFDVCSFCNENTSNLDYAVMHSWNGGWSWSSVWNQRKYVVEFPCLTPLITPNVNNTLIAFPTSETDKLTLDKLLPNPASDYIFASIFSPTENEVEMHIMDARGVLVKNKTMILHKGSNTVRISIADLPSGFYMGQIPDASTKQSMLRFVKQRD